MPSQGGGAPVIGRAGRDVPGRRELALSAARVLLVSTAESINPDTPAAELLACLTRYRAHLSALVAASQPEARPTLSA